MAFSNSHNRQAYHNFALNQIYSLCNPAFTEAARVTCHSDAYFTALRRLSTADSTYCQPKDYGVCEGWVEEMEFDAGAAALKRTTSQHSYASVKSSKSQTVRGRPRKYASYMSSSASSISDKSLTSFPSLSPESPTDERSLIPKSVGEDAIGPRKLSDGAPSISSLTAALPSVKARTALFDDAPLSTNHVPGSIHTASDEHIARLIARNGAVAFVRQIAEDLAHRDAQIAALTRKAENKEKALRKLVRECGLSTLEMETRLRTIEAEQRDSSTSNSKRSSITGLEDLMSDAMGGTMIRGEVDNEATIRAVDKLRALDERPRAASKGWKDYIWGTTSKRSSRASSINGDAASAHESITTWAGSNPNRKSVLQNELFQPPESIKYSTQGSSQQSSNVAAAITERKPSSGFASLALKLVAGTNNTARDDSATGRGRANSAGTKSSTRAESAASMKTTRSARPAPMRAAPKSIPGPRRAAASTSSGQTGTVRGPPERWDTMGSSPQSTTSAPQPGADNYGPVEMDSILPPETQPPTLTYVYNNQYNPEYLTDRFGFIYDQRRKKRQREAAEKMKKTKRGSRVEMLSSARSGVSEDMTDTDFSEDFGEDRPDTPISIDTVGDEDKPTKKWQDYLKIATFPTELLSHTPSGAVPAFEVMEGGEVPLPRSPGITTEERGFLPSASSTAAQPTLPVTSENATISKPHTTATPPTELAQEDAEPVKLLLKQLGEVHDSLQRDKTVRWNDFLRKVRAERKRDGEAAAAALAATCEARSHKPIAIMPEATLTDGEMIGVAGLGNKGKVGRAKWNEFKALVLGGIPVAYRAKIWAECSGAVTLRIPGYYEDLVSRPSANDDPSILGQIQMDINRTLTDNIFFRKGPGVNKLNEVLLAYSRRNAEVGYCQGMNLITACLLLIMPTAEDAFWVLTSIIENILPRGYYDHQLLASRADQIVLRQYVSEILPKLSSHLDALSIELEALTFQWFLSVFTDCLSAEALFRVWDVVFCTNDGSTFLFQVALALLKLNEIELLKCGTPAGVYTYINHQMTNHAISIDGLIHASEGLRKVVKREEVEDRRRRAIEAEKDLMRQREEKNAKRRAERLAAASQLDLIKEASPVLEMETQAQVDVEIVNELVQVTPRPIDESAEGVFME